MPEHDRAHAEWRPGVHRGEVEAQWLPRPAFNEEARAEQAENGDGIEQVEDGEPEDDGAGHGQGSGGHAIHGGLRAMCC